MIKKGIVQMSNHSVLNHYQLLFYIL